MKRLRFLMPLCLYLALLLCACQPTADPPSTTTQPTTVPTQPATQPTTTPVTEPEPDLCWLVTDRISPSYMEFFTTDLPYYTTSYQWTVPQGDKLAQFSIRSDTEGLYVTRSYWTVDHRIPNSEGLYELPIAGADGKWAYLVSPEGILQLEMLTGETCLLVPNDGIIQAALCGYDVLYYAAVNDGTLGIYRLYLPTMTQDTICEGIEVNPNTGRFSISFPRTTLGSVTWSCVNPDMMTRLTAELNDPDSPYKKGDGQMAGPVHLWEDPSILQDPDYYWDNSILWVCRKIQEDTGIHTWYKCTYDPSTGTLTEDTGVIDNCWFGSGYAHNHYEPEVTSLPDPSPAVGQWIPITGTALPDTLTAEELYAEETSDYYDAGIPSLWVLGQPLQSEYVYYIEDNILTQAVDVPVTMAANSVHFIYCVTKDNTLLQISHDGTIRNVLYTAESEIRDLGHANGRLYILDGNKIIELDIPALQYRVLLEQESIIEVGAGEDSGVVYFAVARGLHYQQYLFTPDTGKLERTHIL